MKQWRYPEVGFVPAGHLHRTKQGAEKISTCCQERLRGSSFVQTFFPRSVSARTLQNSGHTKTLPTAVFLWLNPGEGSGEEEEGDDSADGANPDDEMDGYLRDEDEEDSSSSSWDKSGRFSSSRKGRNGDDTPGKRPWSFSGAEALRAKSFAIYSQLGESSPEDYESLKKELSTEAFFVIQKTALGMVGSLPESNFDIRVLTERSGMHRLLYSSMMTGYVLRNAEHRMSMNEKVKEGVAKVFRSVESSPTGSDGQRLPEYMRNVPDKKRLTRVDVKGTVSWRDTREKKTVVIEANEYIDRLENEIEWITRRMEPEMSQDMTNRLLLFMTRLGHNTVASFGSEVSPAATMAMQRILNERLGVLHERKMKMSYSLTREYLAQYICWCLLIGFNVRILEKQGEVEDLLTSYKRGMHQWSNLETPPPSQEDSST